MIFCFNHLDLQSSDLLDVILETRRLRLDLHVYYSFTTVLNYLAVTIDTSLKISIMLPILAILLRPSGLLATKDF